MKKNPIIYVLLIFLLFAITCLSQTQCIGSTNGEQRLTDPIIKIMDGLDANAIYVYIKPGSHRIIDPPPRYIFKKKNDVLIQMNGFRHDLDPENPALNYHTIRLAIPPEAIESSIKVTTIQHHQEIIEKPYTIPPAPPLVYDSANREELERLEYERWGFGKQIVNGQNVLVYNKDRLYPNNGYRLGGVGRMRKWKILSIKFYPFTYNPVKRQLSKTRDLILKIGFLRNASSIDTPKTRTSLLNTTADKQAQKLLYNFTKAQKWYQPKPTPRPVPDGELPIDDPPRVNVNYVIVTTDQIFTNTPELTDFCFHKQEQGFSVMVVTENLTHEVTGDPGEYTFTVNEDGYTHVADDELSGTAEKIRSWLQERYIAFGIEYVLLVGNPDPDSVDVEDPVGDIPMQLCWNSVIADQPTDFYYSDLTGDWNLDNDQYICENYDIEGSSRLPSGVDSSLFSARWEGVIMVEGSTGATDVRLYGHSEGQLRLWVDAEKDGFTDEDLIIDDPMEHPPAYHSQTLSLTGDGLYPVRIEYRQTGGHAYCSFTLHYFNDGVTRAFKHDDTTGVYVNGLEGAFYNDTGFSAPIDAVEISSAYMFEAVFITGDKGLGGVDFYPEVIVGRIPCYDENNDGSPDYNILGSILSKTIAYENVDIRDENWRRRVLISTPLMYDYDDVPGYETADYKGGEYLMNHTAPPPLWDWYRIHDEDYTDAVPDAEVNTGCSVDETIDGWNDPAIPPDDGRGIVMWRTHGWQTGADHVLTNDRCEDLDDTKPSMVIQTTCKNGYPEVEIEPDGSRKFPLPYSLLKHGAVATISASRMSTGTTFDPAAMSIDNKDNSYLMYFLAKGIMDNVPIGSVLSHVREADAGTISSWY